MDYQGKQALLSLKMFILKPIKQLALLGRQGPSGATLLLNRLLQDHL
jgi:hypothetical protein